MEPITAGKKPLTVKPGVKKATSPIEMALTTKRNKPRVRTVRGRVKRTRIGRTIALTNPIIAAAMTAAVTPSIVRPGTSFAVITKDAAATAQVNKKLTITVFLNFLHLYCIGLTQRGYGEGQPRGDCPYKPLYMDILRKSCCSDSASKGNSPETRTAILRLPFQIPSFPLRRRRLYLLTARTPKK